MTDTAFLIVGIILTLVGGFLACVIVKHRISCSEKNNGNGIKHGKNGL